MANCGRNRLKPNSGIQILAQHVHIIGICGTFMGSLALLAKAAGYRVTGCDAGVYPPMSTQLQNAGIELIEGFSADQLSLKPDIYVVGNVVSRGNPLMEAILDRGLAYISGPQWLSENILRDKWVLAVAGTHGKTTTTSMLAWILEFAGFDPGFLIGGVPRNFDCSARLGRSDFFVVEADEYDTAFFDKRSKFVHYRPRTLIINNLEFDHADIFNDLAAIQTQFHHLIRIVPRDGQVIYPEHCAAIEETLALGCWSQKARSALISKESNAQWQYRYIDDASNNVVLTLDGEMQAEICWNMDGRHNIENAIHAVAAARHVGIQPQVACAALAEFSGVKRRMEIVASAHGVTVYDDFAHHPTAIETTLDGLRRRVGDEKILAVIEPRSNTMKQGVHSACLRAATAAADWCFWFASQDLAWSLEDNVRRENGSAQVYSVTDDLIKAVLAHADGQTHIVVMSNGGFDGMSGRLASAIEAR